MARGPHGIGKGISLTWAGICHRRTRVSTLHTLMRSMRKASLPRRGCVCTCLLAPSPLPAGAALLEPFKPRAYEGLVNGKSVAAAGCEPILHMRHFQKHKALSPAFVASVVQRHAPAA